MGSFPSPVPWGCGARRGGELAGKSWRGCPRRKSGHGICPWGSELPCSRNEGVDAEHGEDMSSTRAWELVEARPGG